MSNLDSLKNFIGQGGTPKNLMENVFISNPMIRNLVSLAKSGNQQGVETFARNLFKERGRDFDKEFSEFRNSFK